MDSMMIASNIRFLSRMALLCTCISKLSIYISKSHPDLLEEIRCLLQYTDPNDYNKVFYHPRSAAMEGKIRKLLEDSVRRMRKKEDGGLDSSVIQNPSDPDAAYRVKAGKTCRGYAEMLQNLLEVQELL